MAFWDFFRKKKEEVSIENVSLENLEGWFLNKKRDVEKEQGEFLVILRERTQGFISELKDKISIVNKIDVDAMKSEDRIKIIVKENLRNYLDHLNKLIFRLEELGNGKDIPSNVNFIFFDFRKKSTMSYEKSTILIGKELAEIRDSIKRFFRDLEELMKDHKKTFDKSRIFRLIDLDIKRFESFKEAKSGIAGNIREYDIQISNLKDDIKSKNEEIESLKKTERFIEQSKKQEDLDEKRRELNREIVNLGMMIDFKALSNFYHKFEKEMRIVKEHKENFKETFKKTGSGKILLLLRESNLHNADILNKIQKIEDKQKEVDKIVIEDIGMGSLEEEINNMKPKIEIIDSDRIANEKRLKKYESDINEIVESVRHKLAELNVSLVD